MIILSSKPRTTDLRPWLWGAAFRGSPEHSPRSNRAGSGTHRFLTTELERGSSPRLRTGRSVVRGKVLALTPTGGANPPGLRASEQTIS